MIIQTKKEHKKPEKRYLVREVSQALGLSYSAIATYFSNRKVSIKGGLTLAQIKDVAMAKRRGDINWDVVHEIEQRLTDEFGIIVIRENQQISVETGILSHSDPEEDDGK